MRQRYFKIIRNRDYLFRFDLFLHPPDTYNMPPMAHLQLPFVVTLLLLLLCARVLGELFERIGAPAMIGEVLAGVLLGPSIIGLIAPSPEINVISDLAVFLLVVMAGMEISPGDIWRSLNARTFWIALFGFMVPFMSGALVGFALGYNLLFAFFIGLCVSITALPVIVRILADLDQLQTPLGQKIITLAIFNDVLTLLIFGILLDFHSETGSVRPFFHSVGITVLKLGIFILLLGIVYRILQYASKRLDFLTIKLDRLLKSLKGKESLFALVMLFILAFASISEFLGINFIVGAFFGTILIPRVIVSREDFRRVKESATGISSGFLVPIFFAAMGASFSLSVLKDFNLCILLLLTAITSKILGGFLGGVFSGMNRKESLILGIGINAGGVMALVMANIALIKGLIDQHIFSILVLLSLITTLLTPLLLKVSLHKTKQSS